MGTGFARQGQPFLSRAANGLRRVAEDVRRMCARAPSCGRPRHVSTPPLRLRRAPQVGSVRPTRPSSRQDSLSQPDPPQHEQDSARLPVIGRSQSSAGNRRAEFLHARGREKALEAEDARSLERFELSPAARHGPTPETHVNAAARPPTPPSCAEPRPTCRRHAVQRHIDDRRHTARGGRTGRGLENLPIRSSGPVDGTWVSTRPGRMTASPASTDSGGAGESRGLDGTMRPNRTRMAAGRIPSGVRTRLPRRRRSSPLMVPIR
jgi:hypothetical protein